MNKVQVNHLWPVILIKMTPNCVLHHCPELTECLSLRENRLAKSLASWPLPAINSTKFSMLTVDGQAHS